MGVRGVEAVRGGILMRMLGVVEDGTRMRILEALVVREDAIRMSSRDKEVPGTREVETHSRVERQLLRIRPGLEGVTHTVVVEDVVEEMEEEDTTAVAVEDSKTVAYQLVSDQDDNQVSVYLAGLGHSATEETKWTDVYN